MVIDFHTHVFPEVIAARSIAALETNADLRAYTDGTLAGLKRSMKESGVDYSVILPVATRPSQFQSINTYAASITGKDGILSFGGIHPETEHYREELDQIKALGLKGIKLHPDYQQCFVDDPKSVRIISYAVSIGLFVILHAGIDIGLPEVVHCPPERTLRMLRQVYGGAVPEERRIILAHTGGWEQWDQVEELLVGEPVYLDISFSMGMIRDEQLLRIIRNHGTENILFATDSPWAGQKETLEYFRALPLSKDEKEQILWKNAARLLDLSL